MAQTASNLMDHVIPKNVPLRQWVLTVPHELRARLAFDRQLLGGVCRVFVETVLGFYQRTSAMYEARGGQGGAVTVVQRVSADLRLNPHLHSVFLDGVFAPDSDGELVFHALPSLSNGQVADVMQAVRIRVLRYLARQGVIDDTRALSVVDSDFAEREPALAALASASVSGLMPAGPERRQRVPVELRGEPGLAVVSALSVVELGFSLHANTVARADDDAGREALVKYVLRPPIAQERVKLLSDGLVRIELRRPFRDGTIAVDLDPLSLLARLCAAVPPRRMHLTRYAGVLSAHHKWRAKIVPPPPLEDPSDDEHPHEKPDKPATHRSGYRSWAKLMKRSIGVDAGKCDACGAKMKLRALVFRAESIERYLRHLDEPTDVLPLAPARDPPYFMNRALRRKLSELDAAPAQMEFGA